MSRTVASAEQRSSLYPTPWRLARACVKAVGVRPGMRVLEPCAGDGVFVRELVAAGAVVDAVEIDPQFRQHLIRAGANRTYIADARAFRPTDPLGLGVATNPRGKPYDLVLTNMPFPLIQEIVPNMLECVVEGGWVATIARSNFFGSGERSEFFDDICPVRHRWTITPRPVFVGSTSDNCEYDLVLWQRGWRGAYTGGSIRADGPWRTARESRADPVESPPNDAPNNVRVVAFGADRSIDQLDLPLGEVPDIVAIPRTDEQLSLAERFERFHRLNPEVYVVIVRVARYLREQGFRRGSMKMIFERLRWVHAIRTRGDTYQLNNNFHAFYARLVTLAEEDLADFFELRAQRDPWEPSEELLRALG